jgi:hypothetical protein
MTCEAKPHMPNGETGECRTCAQRWPCDTVEQRVRAEQARDTRRGGRSVLDARGIRERPQFEAR